MSARRHGPFEYQIFGLRVRSEIVLPELFPAEGQGDPDVTIVRQGEGSCAPEQRFGPDERAAVLAIPEIATFKIAAGRSIMVEQDPSTPDRNVRLYLLGSAFGLLLLQRGLLPLHANAVQIGDKAVAFMGPSGCGKSTLAAWISQQGYELIADDVCVVGFGDSGRPYAAPGLPRLRLWGEALRLLGREIRAYERSYVGGDDEYDKFDVPVGPAAAARLNVELAAVYLLDRGDAFAVTATTGLEAAEALFANTYRGSYLQLVNGHEDHWRSATRLVQGVPVYRAVRNWGLDQLDEQCQLLLSHASYLVRSTVR